MDGFTFKRDSDCYGNDILTHPVIADTPDDCAEICRSKEGCIGFVIRLMGNDWNCYLKKSKCEAHSAGENDKFVILFQGESFQSAVFVFVMEHVLSKAHSNG